MYTTRNNSGARTSAAAVVIAVHAAVIYALAVTMGVVEAPPIAEPIKAVIIESPPVEPEPYVPPETPPVAQQPVVEVPLPEIPPVETITVPPAKEVPPSVEPSTAPVMEAKSLSVTRRVEPVYPPASRRLDEHGVVRLRILVDERGRPREVQIAKSSGFDRLDEAAVTAVRRWQFSPAMRESRAVTAWTQVNVLFQLNR